MDVPSSRFNHDNKQKFDIWPLPGLHALVIPVAR